MNIIILRAYEQELKKQQTTPSAPPEEEVSVQYRTPRRTHVQTYEAPVTESPESSMTYRGMPTFNIQVVQVQIVLLTSNCQQRPSHGQLEQMGDTIDISMTSTTQLTSTTSEDRESSGSGSEDVIEYADY